jgi:hypothetical protein
MAGLGSDHIGDITDMIKRDWEAKREKRMSEQVYTTDEINSALAERHRQRALLNDERQMIDKIRALDREILKADGALIASQEKYSQVFKNWALNGASIEAMLDANDEGLKLIVQRRELFVNHSQMIDALQVAQDAERCRQLDCVDAEIDYLLGLLKAQAEK